MDNNKAPLYKTGDIVQYNSHIKSILEDDKPKIILEVYSTDAPDCRYLVLSGDRKIYVYQSWLEVVQ